MTYELPTLPKPAAFDIYEKSRETMEWLRNNIKVGFTAARGPAWWANGATTKAGDWTEIPDGSHFDGPVPIEAVLATLDVQLVKGQVHVTYLDENGERQVVADPAVQPIVNAKTGKVFSYPKESYAIHPYLQTLHGFIQKIQYDEAVAVASVGLLRNGGVAFLQAVLPEQFEVAGFGYVPYLMAVTSADLSRRTQYALGFQAGVCDNTVNAAVLGALKLFGFKHSRNSLPQVQSVREGLGLQLSQAGETIATGIENLLKVDVSGGEFTQWLDKTESLVDDKGEAKTGRSLTMVTNRRDEKIRLWTKDEKVAPWAGTGFGILQLDNTYRTWNQTVKNVDGGRLERNYSNAAFGVSAKADTEALQILADIKGKTLTFA